MIRDNVTGLHLKPGGWLMCVFFPVTLNTVILHWRGQGSGNDLKVLTFKERMFLCAEWLSQGLPAYSKFEVGVSPFQDSCCISLTDGPISLALGYTVSSFLKTEESTGS